MEKIEGSIIRKLKLPRTDSHKGENGRLLVIAGNEMYFEALLYAIRAASRIVDLVYVLTTRENRKLVEKLKSKTAEFMLVHNAPFTPSYLKRGDGELSFDCVLIGPGMGKSKRTYQLVERVLKSGIKAVLDADALNVLDAELLKCLNGNHILTPHTRKFARLLQPPLNLPLSASTRQGEKKGGHLPLGEGEKRRAVQNFAKKYGCSIVLKGKVDIVAGPDGRISENYTGNEGMTKGGTGDVLAGLIAAFYCRSDAFTSAAAGVYLNGVAGDELYKRVGPIYNSEDLVEQIPRTLWRHVKLKS
ncbi:MAG: NAD(P)H-hydrate dehydratase [bacterium]|nr:NAD(P)H-hydrate dehydratase [bacterium]